MNLKTTFWLTYLKEIDKTNSTGGNFPHQVKTPSKKQLTKK